MTTLRLRAGQSEIECRYLAAPTSTIFTTVI
jgi:hypothetical protein